MDETAPTPAPTKPRGIPGRIGGVLKLLTTLVTHARFFSTIANTRVKIPEFAVAAAVFGTYDLPTILFRVRRGILRALALQEYLLARAARGRNLRFTWKSFVSLEPRHQRLKQVRAPRATPLPPRRPEPAVLADNHPDAFRMPTPDELAKEVRRRSIGRTISYICMDIGLVPGFCGGTAWMQVYNILGHYNGSISRMYKVRERREQTFRRERDRRPDTWHINWQDFRDETVRLALGCKIGEPVPDGFDGPVIVPG